MVAFNLFMCALLGSVIALFGGVVFLFNRRLSSILEKYSVPFAAGVLVTVSLLGLIPEAEHEVGEAVYWIVLASFITVYLFEHLFFGIHHHGVDDEHPAPEPHEAYQYDNYRGVAEIKQVDVGKVVY